jgi:hypothetical protein
VSLDDARIAAQPTLVDGRPPDASGKDGSKDESKDGISTYARSVLEQSLREAVARGEAFIGPEHVLLALLREDVGGAARTLSQLGIDPDTVRRRLAVAPRARRA